MALRPHRDVEIFRKKKHLGFLYFFRQVLEVTRKTSKPRIVRTLYKKSYSFRRTGVKVLFQDTQVGGVFEARG